MLLEQPKNPFYARICVSLHVLLTLQAGGDIWGSVTALAIPVGPPVEELRYLKSTSMHVWLFGYELPGREVADTVGWICQGIWMWLPSFHAAPRVNPGAALVQLPGPLKLLCCGCADTIVVLTKRELHIITSNKKGAPVLCAPPSNPEACAVTGFEKAAATKARSGCDHLSINSQCCFFAVALHHALRRCSCHIGSLALAETCVYAHASRSC